MDSSVSQQKERHERVTAKLVKKNINNISNTQTIFAVKKNSLRKNKAFHNEK